MAYPIPEPDRRLGFLLPKLILASQSPARRSLLEMIGCHVTVSPTDSDEYHGGVAGAEVVRDLAIRKMENYLASVSNPSLPVLTADTLIGYEGKLIGKPKHIGEARNHLLMFSGSSHSVYSGFSLRLPSGHLYSGADEAKVTFAALSPQDIERYLETGDWKGAAGSYRIQGAANAFIVDVSGDFATVVGLPLQAISAILSSPGCL